MTYTSKLYFQKFLYPVILTLYMELSDDQIIKNNLLKDVNANVNTNMWQKYV